jgi:serine protease Do
MGEACHTVLRLLRRSTAPVLGSGSVTAHRRAIAAATLVLAALVACQRPAPGPAAGAPPPQAGPASPLPPLEPGRDPIVRVAERVRPAVVNVTADLGGGQDAEGTGFVVREDGVIVTNFHVVAGGLSIEVVTAEGDTFDGRVVGGSSDDDLAVVEVDAQDLPTVELGSSDRLRLGETVVALGFALGLEGGPSVTSGIVSALGRTITAGDPNAEGGSRRYEGLIQTDAAINPGNSGGPLVDLSGQVVGINTAGVGAAAAENIGFAIAIDRARPIIEHAISNPDAPTPYLGVSTVPLTPAIAAQEGLSVDRGVLVLDVLEGGPADRAGVEAGDVIVSLADAPIENGDELTAELLSHRPGEAVDVQVVRGATTETFTVTLGVRPLPVEPG